MACVSFSGGIANDCENNMGGVTKLYLTDFDNVSAYTDICVGLYMYIYIYMIIYCNVNDQICRSGLATSQSAEVVVCMS